MEYEYHEYASLFPMVEGDTFESLKNDIKKNGLIEAIYLYEGKIIDGRNRYRACLELGIEPKVREYTGDKPVDFIISLNKERRHLTSNQWATIAVDALPMFEKEAKKRQGQRTDLNIETKLSQSERGKSAEKAGKVFGVSGTYIKQAKLLKAENLELFEEVKSGKKKLGVVMREIKEKKQTAEITHLTPPTGEFNVIVVDPPWKPTIGYHPEGWRGEGNYPKMSMEEIKNIKLPAAKDCILWLWCIDYFIKDALEIIEHWGFERKSTLIWDKGSMGLGHWLRLEHEYCFLAVKGKPKFFGNNARSVLHASKTKNHSEKPDAFYKLVEETCKYPKKLDYFARKKREGWEVFGDEVKQ